MGDQSAYGDLMKRAHNAAWDRNWAEAISLYRSAAAELPEQAGAHAALASALEETGQLDEALQEYSVSEKLLPRDPVPVARIGQVLEKQGKRTEAGQTYARLAELFVQANQTNQAIKTWQRVNLVDPQRTDTRLKLIQVLIGLGRRSEAAGEVAGLAHTYLRRGERDKASAFLEQAHRLDPTDAATIALQRELAGAGMEGSPEQKSEPRQTSAVDGAQPEQSDAQNSRGRDSPGSAFPGSDQVLEALALSEEYSRRGLHGAASDEAMQAITIAPNFLPAHVRLAESLLAEGMAEQGIAKYLACARTAEVRGETAFLAALYSRLAEVAPDPQARGRFSRLGAEAQSAKGNPAA